MHFQVSEFRVLTGRGSGVMVHTSACVSKAYGSDFKVVGVSSCEHIVYQKQVRKSTPPRPQAPESSWSRPGSLKIMGHSSGCLWGHE